MAKVTLPPSGAVVVFTRVPTASYADPGEAYRVEYGARGTVRIEHARFGCATYDPRWAWRDAVWTVQP